VVDKNKRLRNYLVPLRIPPSAWARRSGRRNTSNSFGISDDNIVLARSSLSSQRDRKAPLHSLPILQVNGSS
jgi:hypothetical protein